MRDIYIPEDGCDCCENCWYCRSGLCGCEESVHYGESVDDTDVCGHYETIWQGDMEAGYER